MLEVCKKGKKENLNFSFAPDKDKPSVTTGGFMLSTLLSILLLSQGANATDLICEMAANSTASTLKISYNDLPEPTGVFLRSPEEDVFRKLNMKVDVVFERNEVLQESFSAVPNNIPAIDWEQHEACYLEVGTQWYFVFDHLKQNYLVQFLPYFVKEYETCVVPRFRPQNHKLICTDS